MRISRSVIIDPIILLAAAVICGQALISSKMNLAMDSIQYLTSLMEFEQNLAQGEISPEWAPDLSFGYGQPLFTFLPPGFNWLCTAIGTLGFAKTSSINASLLIIIILSALTMYLWTKPHLGRSGALVSSLAYIYTPYFLVSLYVRGSYGEFTAFPFFPLVLWGLDGLIKSFSVRRAFAAAFGTAAIFLAHNGMALIFAPVAIAYPFMMRDQSRGITSCLPCYLFLALGILIASYFWLPALFYRELVSVHRLLNGYLNYSNHLIYLSQLFYSPWGYEILLPGRADGMSQEFGYLQWAALFLSCIFLVFNYLKPQSRRWALVLACISAYALFLSSYYSKFIWDRVELLQYIQFGMRFLAISAFSSAALIGIMATKLEGVLAANLAGRYAPIATALVFAAAITVMSLGKLGPKESYWAADSDHAPDRISRGGYGAINKEEFQPRSAWLIAPFSTEAVEIADGEVSIRSARKSSFGSILNLEVVSSQAKIRLQHLNFPGWKIESNGAPISGTSSIPHGLIEVILPKGIHAVTAKFVGTPWRNRGELISILGLLLTIIFARQLRCRLRHREHKANC